MSKDGSFFRDHPGRKAVTAEMETAYKGFFSIGKYSLSHETHDGDRTPLLTREVMLRKPVAGVLPWDPVKNEFVLVQQFRVGPFSGPGPVFPVELVAGIIDGEDGDPEETIRREALEEAGITLKAVHQIARFYPSPGGCSELMTLFVGLCDAPDGPGVFGVADEGEDILACPVSCNDALKLRDEGLICDASTLLALSWVELHGEKVRENGGFAV